jgi:hypothetical protein
MKKPKLIRDWASEFEFLFSSADLFAGLSFAHPASNPHDAAA